MAVVAFLSSLFVAAVFGYILGFYVCYRFGERHGD